MCFCCAILMQRHKQRGVADAVPKLRTKARPTSSPLWAMKSEDVGLTVRAICFQDFQPMWSWSINITDRQTDDMWSQDHALHYSASRDKNQSGFTGAGDSEWQWHRISWAICKLAPRPMPASNNSSFLQARCPSCHPTNSIKALNAVFVYIYLFIIYCNKCKQTGLNLLSVWTNTGQFQDNTNHILFL